MNQIAVGFAIFFGLTLLGLDIWLVMAVVGILVILFEYADPELLVVAPQTMLEGVGGMELGAIPLFILAGELMNRGGITARLLEVSRLVIGGLKGGLAMVGVLVNMLMSGVSGSAVADASGTASVLLPAMRRDGYRLDYAAAVIGSAATIGPIIPPSIPFIVFGVLANVSVGRLFLAGVVPGLLMGAALLAACYYMAIRHNHPAPESPGWDRAGRIVGEALLALAMPIFIIGGIVFGFATPTEIAAVAAAYAAVVGVCVHREIALRELPDVFGAAALMSAVILITLATAATFAWAMTVLQIGPLLASLVASIGAGEIGVLLAINVLLLLVGCVFEPLPAMVIFVPMLLPLVTSLGVDLVHFGLIVVLNLTLGLLTPPVGLNLFITASIAKVPVEAVFRQVTPLLLVLIGVLLLCTLWPPLTLWLPELLMG